MNRSRRSSASTVETARRERADPVSMAAKSSSASKAHARWRCKERDPSSSAR